MLLIWSLGFAVWGLEAIVALVWDAGVLIFLLVRGITVSRRLRAAEAARHPAAVEEVVVAEVDSAEGDFPATPVEETQSRPPGWYADPVNGRHQRWWSGRGWTAYTRTAQDAPVQGGARPAGARPGWYRNPHNAGELRWWTGRDWSKYTQPVRESRLPSG